MSSRTGALTGALTGWFVCRISELFAVGVGSGEGSAVEVGEARLACANVEVGLGAGGE
jgi:hypothetical protein